MALDAVEAPDKSAMHESLKTKRETAESIAKAVSELREQPWPNNYIIANDEKKLKTLAKHIAAEKSFVFDVETSGTNPWRHKLFCISFWVGDTGYLIPLEHRMMSVVDPALVREHLATAFADPSIFRQNHNIKFDAHFIEEQLGIPVGPLGCDTEVQARVIDPDTQRPHGLKELCAQYGLAKSTGNYTAQFGKTAWSHLDPKLAAYYAIKDCELVIKLRAHQDELLEDTPKLKKLFWDLEMHMVNETYAMERQGMRIDQNYYDEVLKPRVYTEWNAAIDALRPYIEPHLPKDSTIEEVLESPTKLMPIFFDNLDVPLVKFVTLRRGAFGEWNKRSLDKEAVAGLRHQSEPMRLLGEYRKWSTLKKMFIDSLPARIIGDRVHPRINLIVSTGRMSMADPNLQQIPSRMGPLVRNMFIPDDGNIFMSADFSGQEMRILAHYSRDEALMKLYTDPDQKLDVYSFTAVRSFQDEAFARDGISRKKFEKLSKNERKGLTVYRDAKALVLGLGYGMGPSKYARNTGKTAAQGKKDYQGYHDGFPGVKRYQDAQIAKAKRLGYVTTLLGRRRPLPFINMTSDGAARASAERAAMNTPIQGSAADMVKLAARNVARLLRERQWPVRIVILIHDEILFEMPITWAQQNHEAIKEITDTMCSALPLRVPMESSAILEPRWGTEMEVDDLDDFVEELAA